MHRKGNFLFWRKMCRIGACVDLATQIIGVTVMIVTLAIYMPYFIESDMDCKWKALIGIPIFLFFLLHLVFAAGAIMMIRGTGKGRRAKDVLKTATYWMIGQIVLLVASFSSILQVSWQVPLVEGIFRIPLFYVGKKYINWLQTRNTNKDFEEPKDLESDMPSTKQEEVPSPCVKTDSVTEANSSTVCESDTSKGDLNISLVDVTNNDSDDG